MFQYPIVIWFYILDLFKIIIRNLIKQLEVIFYFHHFDD